MLEGCPNVVEPHGWKKWEHVRLRMEWGETFEESAAGDLIESPKLAIKTLHATLLTIHLVLVFHFESYFEFGGLVRVFVLFHFPSGSFSFHMGGWVLDYRLFLILKNIHQLLLSSAKMKGTILLRFTIQVPTGTWSSLSLKIIKVWSLFLNFKSEGYE